MNAVEIEEAVSELARAPFDPAEFPFAFLAAFGNKATTVNRLRTPSLNKSDVAGGVLQARNIHLAVCAEGRVRETMAALRESPKTAANKVKFLLATDGVTLEAEDLVADEPPVVCDYPDFARHFGFFLGLAGISTVRAIKNNPIDIKATGRLNKLYVELLKDNPDWATDARRPEMNRFMARLIFCFFAEDTGIFLNRLFTKTVEQMSDSQVGPSGFSNTHEVLQEMFRAMATPAYGETRRAANFRPWAEAFPFVNGGLFPEAGECPRFSRIARSYLLRAAELNWQEINPDIFGSMIQAVADDEERGELGMHYTSVPNILKVLNPLFLDDLREQLQAAGGNVRKLRNLRKRIGAIRVFDPACGSGNFLVIAYREMRQIEHEIVGRTGDAPKSVIPLANFYGIEIKGFAAEIARLALLIAEFQCDVRLISQKEARLNVLPLHKTGQIRIGNALREDWLEVCPPVKRVALEEHDLAGPTGRLALEGDGLRDIAANETYICGNPPYVGGKKQSRSQKDDMKTVFDQAQHKNLDYVCGFILMAAQFLQHSTKAALVATNSVAQGTHVPTLWPLLKATRVEINFAHSAFKWKNNASRNAGVTCVIIGLSNPGSANKYIFDGDEKRAVKNISLYLVEGPDIVVEGRSQPLSALSSMITGNAAYDEGHLFLSIEEARTLINQYPATAQIVRRATGTTELIDGVDRYCIWIDDELLVLAKNVPFVQERIEKVHQYRIAGGEVARTIIDRPHQFRYRHVASSVQIVVPQVSSERRPYLPIGWLKNNTIITHLAHAIYEPSLVDFTVLSSRIHLAWVTAICGKLETRIRYASNSGWNAFPLPALTQNNVCDLTRCAEDILLAREAHFPATIADLYDPETMPDDLRAAHERNDETLERIYIGRRFRNDTERLEKLFEMYTRMVAAQPPKPGRKQVKA